MKHLAIFLIATILLICGNSYAEEVKKEKDYRSVLVKYHYTVYYSNGVWSTK